MSEWVQQADEIAVEQAAPHGGRGPTLAAPFFADEAPGLDFVVRRRTLPKGASIGAHQHDKDEVYYVVSGAGAYTLDDETFDVRAGHALLVRPGHTHALEQRGEAPLVVLIVYRGPPAVDSAAAR